MSAVYDDGDGTGVGTRGEAFLSPKQRAHMDAVHASIPEPRPYGLDYSRGRYNIAAMTRYIVMDHKRLQEENAELRAKLEPKDEMTVTPELDVDDVVERIDEAVGASEQAKRDSFVFTKANRKLTDEQVRLLYRSLRENVWLSLVSSEKRPLELLRTSLNGFCNPELSFESRLAVTATGYQLLFKVNLR